MSASALARTLREVASVEARKRLAYRMDFWVGSAFGVLVHFAVFYYLWTSLFSSEGVERMGGMDVSAVILYYAAVLLMGRLVRGPDFDSGVSTDIYEGALNRYLVLPLPYFAFKYAQHLGSLVPVLLQALVMAAIAALALAPSESVHIDGLGAGRALVSLWMAHLLYFLMAFLLQCVAFWADNVWSLSVALRLLTDFLGGLLLPLAFLPGWAQALGEWLPFQCLFSIPVRTLFGQVAPGEWAASLAVGAAWSVVLAACCAWTWRRGTLQYSGVGI